MVKATRYYFIVVKERMVFVMAWDSIWEQVFQQQQWGKHPGEDLIRFVARNFYKFSVRQDIKILEVGCGPGANLWYMAREGFTVYGIDGSHTAVACAQQRLDTECLGWKGQVLTGDIVNLPFDEGYFDGVIDNEAICCNSFAVSKVIYSEMARVVKQGGKLFSRTFATGCWGDRTGESIGHRAYHVSEGPLFNKGYARFTDKEEISLLVSENFGIDEIELLTRTADNQKHEIREWIIIATKK